MAQVNICEIVKSVLAGWCRSFAAGATQVAIRGKSLNYPRLIGLAWLGTRHVIFEKRLLL